MIKAACCVKPIDWKSAGNDADVWFNYWFMTCGNSEAFDSITFF